MLERCLHSHVHCRIIPSRQERETACGPVVGEWVKKRGAVHPTAQRRGLEGAMLRVASETGKSTAVGSHSRESEKPELLGTGRVAARGGRGSREAAGTGAKEGKPGRLPAAGCAEQQCCAPVNIRTPKRRAILM